MLSSSSLLYKEHLYSFLRPWLGDGLLTSSGARWLKHQKLYVPAFERAAIEGYLRVVHRTGEKFVQKLAQQADEQQPFDAQQLVAKCTLDIVCGKVWGRSNWCPVGKTLNICHSHFVLLLLMVPGSTRLFSLFITAIL